MHAAARSGDVARVRELLDAGAEPDPVPTYGTYDTPVLTEAGSVEVFSELLAAGARVDPDLPHGRSVLREVAQQHRVNVAERVEMVKLLQAAGVEVDALSPDRGTALASIAMIGDADAVEVLLAVGADPNLGHSALASACFRFSRERDPSMERTIALLVAAGVDKDGADPRGFRPIHAAVSDDRYGPGFASSDGIGVAAIAALIDLDADVDAPFPDSGWRPIHLAAEQGRAIAVQLFLDAGIDPTGPTPEGETALDLARDAVVRYSTQWAPNEAFDERLMARFVKTYGRERGAERLATIHEIERRGHAERRADAEACVALLESALSASGGQDDER